MTREHKIRTRTPLPGGGYEVEYDDGIVERFTAKGVSLAFKTPLPEGGYQLARRDGRIERFDADGDLHSFDDQPAVEDGGYRCWCWHGRKHRGNDLPAETWPDGASLWYKNGRFHRVGGPAVIEPRGKVQQWYENGVLHRVGGPAEIGSGYGPLFFLNGKQVSEAEAMAAAQPDLPETCLAGSPDGPIQVPEHVSHTKTGAVTMVRTHTRRRSAR